MLKNDLINKKFGRLTALNIYEIKDKHAYWVCRCDCGNVVIVKRCNLISGNTKSCGCYMLARIKESNTTHGKKNTKAYVSWAKCKRRCYSENEPSYKDYGARGIKMCDSWFNSFEEFFNDMGECPEGMTLERINNNGNYEPNNCRWATKKEQANNRRSNINITYNNKTQNLKQWSNELGISYYSLIHRVKKSNWSIEKAFSTPTRYRAANK